MTNNETTTETITYAVERLDSGARRWAITRNGVPIVVRRKRQTAEKDVLILTDFLDLMGRESSMVDTWLKHPNLYLYV